MKIGQYCQRQRCKDVESEQFLCFGMLSRRSGLSATAGLSCFWYRTKWEKQTNGTHTDPTRIVDPSPSFRMRQLWRFWRHECDVIESRDVIDDFINRRAIGTLVSEMFSIKVSDTRVAVALGNYSPTGCWSAWIHDVRQESLDADVDWTKMNRADVNTPTMLLVTASEGRPFCFTAVIYFYLFIYLFFSA